MASIEKMAVLGPEGTYSEQAAKQYLPRTEIAPADTFEEVLASVGSGGLKACVLPIENAIGGNVTPGLDALYESRDRPLTVIGRVDLRVHHWLFSAGSIAELGPIEAIYSHEQGLKQGKKELDRLFPSKVPRIKTVSTVSGIDELVDLRSQGRNAAAVGPEEAGKRRGLTVLGENIEGESVNKTRFLVLADPGLGISPAKETFIAAIPEGLDSPNQLLPVLQIIGEAGVNLSLIESRSHDHELGSHRFYVGMDVAGDDPALPELITAIRANGTEVHKLTA